jgi:hypothetical protein
MINSKRRAFVFAAVSLSTLCAGGAIAQDRLRDAEDLCRREAAQRLNVSRNDVSVTNSKWENGEYRVRFDLRNDNTDKTGRCRVSREGQVLEIREPENSGSGWGSGGSGGGWGSGSSGGGWGSGGSSGGSAGWGGSGGSDWGSESSISNFYRIKVDTAGRGSYNGLREGRREVSRGWVDTRSGRPSVSLSGPDNFKVTFYGDITESRDRRMTLRIRESDRGRVNGRAEIRLNGDKNEVEYLEIRGDGFDGNFGRK